MKEPIGSRPDKGAVCTSRAGERRNLLGVRFRRRQSERAANRMALGCEPRFPEPCRDGNGNRKRGDRVNQYRRVDGLFQRNTRRSQCREVCRPPRIE